MKSCSLSSLDDHVLLRYLSTAASQDRGTTAILLGLIAEVDERKLYVRAAYPTMCLYCEKELRMSEDVATERIRVARTARRFPAIFPALADGRLNMTAVLLLTPHLTPQVTPEAAGELLAAAASKTKNEIRLLLAERFPRPDVPTLMQAIGAPGVPVSPDSPALLVSPDSLALQVSPDSPGVPVSPDSPGRPAPRARIAPLSPGKFAWQFTVDQETQDLLYYGQSLLSHALPSGDVPKVLKRILELGVGVLEQKKFAKCTRTRPRRSHANGRYVPAEIRRTVWQRDGGQCTFVSESGKRCEARNRLEFDHIDPVARGGHTTADRMQLRCRAHNQYTAECTFGAGFMHEKRRAQRERMQERKQAREAQVRTQELARERALAQAQAQDRARSEAAATAAADVIPVLRELKFGAEEARRGAALCANIPYAPLEERVRVALRGLAPNCVRRPAPVAS